MLMCMCFNIAECCILSCEIIQQLSIYGFLYTALEYHYFALGVCAFVIVIVNVLFVNESFLVVVNLLLLLFYNSDLICPIVVSHYLGYVLLL